MIGKSAGAVLAASLLFVGCAQAPASTARPILGIVEKDFPVSPNSGVSFDNSVAHANVWAYYSGWEEPFQTKFAKEAASHGASVLVQINPYKASLKSIANGKYDWYLKAFAMSVAKFRHTVILSFAHEMNGYWYPWGYTHTTPAVFVAAWRHVVKIFRAEHAKNVTWLWTVSSAQTDMPPTPRPWWPGSNYVTWVGLDGYFYGNNQTDNFDSFFGKLIKKVRAFTHEPILVSETGVGQVAGQANTIPGLFEGIIHNHLLGLVYFDENQHDLPYHQKWRLEGDPAAVKVFRHWVHVAKL